jgi:hypothetical protein
MLEYLQRLAWDPTAPVPAGWPHGWHGVFILFCVPGGAGVPPGALLGHRDGLGVVFMTVLYFLSDVALVPLWEALLRGLRALGRHVPKFGRALRMTLALVKRTVPSGGMAGPTSVMLMGFGAGLPFGRAVAAGAGYGLVSSWLLSIAGDMIYFTIGMASTLWFDGMIGDPRIAAFAGLAVMVLVPVVVRRLRPSG